MLVAPMTLLAAIALSVVPAAAAQTTCVAVKGPEELSAAVRQGLSERGVVAPTGTCPPATLTLVHGTADSATWSLVTAAGVAAERSFSSPGAGVAWVDSIVHTQRLTGLLSARAEPHVDAPEGVRLYATFDAWRAGVPSAVVDRPLVAHRVDEHLIGDDGLEPMWVLDRSRRAARREGAVFAMEDGDTVYVHDGGPLAARGKPFGRLEVVGDRGLYQGQVCYWMPSRREGGTGHVECDVEIRWLDLKTGAVTALNRWTLAELLADQPDLLAAFRQTRPKNPAVIRRFARAALGAPSEGE